MPTLFEPSPTPAPTLPAAPLQARSRQVVRGGVIGVALAIAGCLAIYAIGNVGAPVRVITGWAPDGADLTVAELLATIIVSVGAGSVLLWAMQRRSPRAWTRWMVAAGVLGVASAVPLTRLAIDTGSKVALIAMHLTTGAAAIAGHVVARSREQGHHRRVPRGLPSSLRRRNGFDGQ